MAHINPATVYIDRDRLNSATALISQDPQNPTLVRMRNRHLAEVYVEMPNDDHECINIRDLPLNFLWEASGHSVTNSDFDIIEVLTT